MQVVICDALYGTGAEADGTHDGIKQAALFMGGGEMEIRWKLFDF